MDGTGSSAIGEAPEARISPVMILQCEEWMFYSSIAVGDNLQNQVSQMSLCLTQAREKLHDRRGGIDTISLLSPLMMMIIIPALLLIHPSILLPSMDCHQHNTGIHNSPR